jgi:hypothetical protein
VNAGEIDLGPGRIVVRMDCAMFKLGIVLGPSRSAGKTRIRTWLNATRSWGAPHSVVSRWLDTVGDDQAKRPPGEAARRRKVVARAIEASMGAGAGQRGWT